MAAESDGERRDSTGMVASGGGGRRDYNEDRSYNPATTVPERLARLEIMMLDSRTDRQRLHERLDETEKNISDQIKVQAERTAYMDVLKWGATVLLTAVAGYFFAILTSHVDRNTQALEQHQMEPHR